MTWTIEAVQTTDFHDLFPADARTLVTLAGKRERYTIRYASQTLYVTDLAIANEVCAAEGLPFKAPEGEVWVTLSATNERGEKRTRLVRVTEQMEAVYVSMGLAAEALVGVSKKDKR